MTTWPKSLEPTAVGAVSFAVAVHVASRRWLSFFVARELSRPLAFAGFYLAVLCLTGCSTTSDHIGSDGLQLKLGQKYELKRDAILLANRGAVDSIENPDYIIESYKAYVDFDPYWTKPRGVLPAGTVLEVREIRFFKHNRFRVMGEIVTGKYKPKAVGAYDVVKGYTVGGWPPTGEVVMNNLCGGHSFDSGQLARNLSEKIE